MKTKFILSFLIIPICCFSQKVGDKIIVLKIADTASFYSLAKRTLIENNFIVKDEDSKSIINTYPKELDNMPGTCVLRVERQNDTVRISGIYGTKRINDWGYTTAPKNFSPIIYFKGSKTWKLMNSIAGKIGTTILYENPNKEN
jgi:hypothetical protein